MLNCVFVFVLQCARTHTHKHTNQQFEVNRTALQRQTRQAVGYKRQLAEASSMLETYQSMAVGLPSADGGGGGAPTKLPEADAAAARAARTATYPLSLEKPEGRKGQRPGGQRPGSGGSLGGMSTGSSGMSIGSAGSVGGGAWGVAQWGVAQPADVRA
eukprot:SAG22_NODE_3647_length_1597_cov_1.019359_3_plen_158_part_00